MTDSTGGTPESFEQGPAPSRAEVWAAARTERRVARLAKQIRAFAGSHGGEAEANLAYIGERGTRIVLVAENGSWGDLMAPTYDLAQRAVERAGVTVHERLDGEFAAKMRTGPYEWTRMAGIQIGRPANT
jgi:aspartate aminotransferase-like enzyme